ncbi:mannose-1-phosphate guanyltransferase [Fusarium solani]
MKGLILVGGFGTRLRPLTLTLPKPLVEFGNKPMIVHQIEALVAAGVTDIVLAVNYRPEIMEKFLAEYEEKYNINIEFSVESEPLDTAGPLKLAESILAKDDSPLLRPQLGRHLRLPLPGPPGLPPEPRKRGYHRRHQGRGALQVRCRCPPARPPLADRPIRREARRVRRQPHQRRHVHLQHLYPRPYRASPDFDREGDLPRHGPRQPAALVRPRGLLDGRRSAQGLPQRHMPVPLLAHQAG